MEDYYELLEVHPRASPEVIARAYRVLVSRYHPDLHPPERRDWAEEMMKRVNEAYGTLGEEKKRSAYDQARELHGTPQPAGVASAPSSTPPYESHRNVTVADVRVCAFHPTRSRVSTCLNCRRSLCSQCRVIQDGRPFCPDCAKTIGTNQESNNSMFSSRSLTHDGPGRTRLAQRPMSEWALILLSASVFAVWLFWGVGPLLIHEVFMLWVVVSICMASGFLLAFALSLVPRIKNPAFWNSLTRSCRISAFVVAALLLTVGIRMNGVALGKITMKIEEGNAKRKKEEQEANARQQLQSFVNAFDPNDATHDSLSQRAKKWAWKEYNRGNDAREPSFEERVYPFSKLKEQNFNIAYENASNYLKSDYSRTQDQAQYRTVCLHFLVWAALRSKTNQDVTPQAKECLKNAFRDDQKVDCHYYLAEEAYSRKDLLGLQTHREELAKIVPPDDPSLKVVDEWIKSLQFPQQLIALRALINKCDPKAKEEGLRILTQEFAQRDSDTFEKVAYELGKCLHDSKDSAGLKQLRDQYMAVSVFKRHQTEFEEWIDALEPSPEKSNQDGAPIAT